MRKLIGLCAAAAALATLVTVSAAAPPDAKKIDRGKYLVENVGMCVDCHTPHLPTGELDKNNWLMGTDLGFQPIHPMPMWAKRAPDIAGLPRWSDEAAVKLMMTGLRPSGSPLRPPMPPYKMNKGDAEAVVAYLRSLKPAGK